MTVQTSYPTHSRQIALLKRRQGNLLVAGILFAAAGFMFFCNIVAVSGISWPMIGLMLLATGLLQLYAACQIREHVAFVMWVLAVGFYFLFGFIALTSPSSRFAALGLIFFIGLIIIGVMRCHCGYMFRFAGRGWRWLSAAAMVTILGGSFLVAGWPSNDLSLAAQLLAVDLAAYGLA